MRKKNITSRFIHKIIFLNNVADSAIEEDRWEEWQSSFAEVQPLCDNRFISLEGMSFGNVITEGYFIFKIRFLAGLLPEMRISFKGRIFEIKRIINENERDKMLDIIALEI